jgi:hypothetical protein
MQGKEMDCMAIDVEVIYPPDDPGKLSRSWTWQAPGPTVIDALNQMWREFNVVEEGDPHVAREARNMCVGDLIVIQGQTFLVACIGFVALTREKARRCQQNDFKARLLGVLDVLRRRNEWAGTPSPHMPAT